MRKNLQFINKLLFVFVAILFANVLHATIHVVQVGVPTNKFTPTSMTVTLDDTVRFQYVTGFHTTTSTSVPPGADTWDEAMQSPGTVYDYVPAVEGEYDYWCVIHGTFMSASFTVTQPLPIKMSLLEGNFVDGTNVKLNWKTYDEKNNNRFEVQKSSDGLKFTTISSIPSQAVSGNSTGTLEYGYTDNAGIKDRIFYRLRQVDNDNKSSYSNVVYLAVKGDKDMVVKIHPNPAQTSVMVHIQGIIPTGAEIQLTDMAGKIIDKMGISSNDMEMPMFDVSKLSSGVYLIKYIDKNQVITEKLTKN